MSPHIPYNKVTSQSYDQIKNMQVPIVEAICKKFQEHYEISNVLCAQTVMYSVCQGHDDVTRVYTRTI